MKTSFLTFVALLLPLLVVAQDTSTCSQAFQDQIQACLDQVTADEGKAPCSSSDFACICEHQEGLIECHKPCPEIQPADDIRFNNENCKGQHGVTNAAGGNAQATYSLSPITTTGSGSGGSTPSASSPSSATTSAAASAASSASTSASASSAASSSAKPNTALSANFPGSFPAGLLVLGGLFLGAIAV
ncbi:hypothetical protein DL96DRAFT_1593618 [Flagelloscypha sp. PMI_526]|nr:hypothetical protein DL96DRAFT_1593618 [Flagelloscypha sp. PMI_526]